MTDEEYKGVCEAIDKLGARQEEVDFAKELLSRNYRAAPPPQVMLDKKTKGLHLVWGNAVISFVDGMMRFFLEQDLSTQDGKEFCNWLGKRGEDLKAKLRSRMYSCYWAIILALSLLTITLGFVVASQKQELNRLLGGNTPAGVGYSGSHDVKFFFRPGLVRESPRLDEHRPVRNDGLPARKPKEGTPSTRPVRPANFFPRPLPEVLG